MRACILTPDGGGVIDPPVHSLLKQWPNLTDSHRDADVVLVPITKLDDYHFNHELCDLKKPWVLVDYVENGWNWDQQETMMFGKNTEKFFGDAYHGEWHRFDQFVQESPPVAVFKRELLEKDRKEGLYPIEYTHWLPEYGLDTQEEFTKRPLELINTWGRSHEARMWFHGSIFTQAPSLGYGVISQFDHIDKEPKDGKKWASIHVPWYARIDVREVQKFNRQSKVIATLPGCGYKTFRHGESCLDGIMAMPWNRLAWSYPWTPSNSIIVPEFEGTTSGEHACATIHHVLKKDPELTYDLYCRAIQNGQNYRYDTYLRRWVFANIARHV